MKHRIYCRVLIAALLGFALSCKHKEIQVTAFNKGRVKTHTQHNKPPADKRSNGGAPGNAGENPLHEKLGLNGKQIKDSKLYSFINDWYGVPYQYGGCQKTGVDCSCFTSILCEKVYSLKLARSAGEMYAACEKIALQDAREGDLCFFKINSGSVSHVGVYLKNRLFVHSSTSKGVVISSLDEAYYKKYFSARAA